MPKSERTKIEHNANGQGTIFWSESRNRYVAQIYDLNGRRITRICKLKKDAQNWIQEQKQIREHGSSTNSANSKLTVTQFLTAWVETKKFRSPETKRNYEGAVKRIAPYIGNQKWTKLSPHLIEQMLRELEGKYSGNTPHNSFSILRAAYNKAVKMGDIAYSPVSKVDAPEKNITSTSYIPSADMAKIYQAASLHPYSHARVEIAMVVPMRPAEILGLKWSDVDWELRTLLIARQLQRVKDDGLVFRPTKDKKQRRVPLSDMTLEILRTHKSFQEMNKDGWPKDYGLIFPNTLGGPLDAKRDHKWWIDILKMAGVGHYQRYQMKKTALSHLENLGTPVSTILKFSGHSNISTVMSHYAFSTDEADQRALAGLDSLRPVFREISE